MRHHFRHGIELYLTLNVMLINIFHEPTLEAIDGGEQFAGVVLCVQLSNAFAHLMSNLFQFDFALQLLAVEVIRQFAEKVAQKLLRVRCMAAAEVVLVDGLVRSAIVVSQELHSWSCLRASGRFS